MRVSIHAPARGATRALRHCLPDGWVSIHAPARGATSMSAGFSTRCRFQSTPLREGRRIVSGSEAKGECFNPRPCARGDIMARHPPAPPAGFNPRPCARGDSCGRTGKEKDHRFQSTPLREGRQAYTHPVIPGTRVSIHAPARGATSISPWFISSRDVSIHAPARGATRWVGRVFVPGRFQSTPLREGRHSRSISLDESHIVSIHAPARGATWQWKN